MKSATTKKFEFLVTLTSVLGGVIAATLFLYQSRFDLQGKEQAVRAAEAQRIAHLLDEQLAESKRELDQVKQATELQHQLIEKLLSKPGVNLPNAEVLREMTAVRADMASTRSQVSTLQSAVNKLDDALQTTPEKALAVPLLKKDIDDLKASSQRDSDSLRNEMVRAYELDKWLGLLTIGCRRHNY